MSLLTLIQGVCKDVGVSSPSTVVGNNNKQIVQLLEIAQKEGKDLASRHGWSAMIRENTWTIATAASQGALNSTVVSDGDFDYLINDTMWNRTTSLPILGPVNHRDWQTLQAFPVTGPYQQYKIEGGILYLDPVPTVADTGAFEYKSTYWCESSGGTGQAAWAADTDVGRLSESLMELGVIWRWRKRKGLEWEGDFKIYEKRVLDAMGRDGSKRTLDLNGRSRDRVPGVIVPLGSWTP